MMEPQRRRGLWWCLPPVVVALGIWYTLGGVRWDPRFPVSYSGDGLFYLAQSKTTIDHGWWWFNPSIGMPFGLPAIIFAQDANVDQAVVWLVGRVVANPFLAVNLAWMLLVALSSVTAAWGLRRLGASRLVAAGAAIIFAASPFALYRNVEQFPMVTYLVPFPATVACLLASGAAAVRWPGRVQRMLLAGCALVGLNFIYPAFFGVVVMLAGIGIGFLRTRSRELVRQGAWCVAAVVLAVALNLSTNVIAWRTYGQPADVDHPAAQSEMFALKPRLLVSPLPGHWFPPFRAWLEREASADVPGENENHFARLGFVPLVCAVLVMGTSLFPRRPAASGHPLMLAAAALMACSLLVATAGGVGSVFSVLVSAAIRSYNRITPFITFFALAGAAVWIDAAMAKWSARTRRAVIAAIVGLALADQHVALASVAGDGPNITAGLGGVAAFIQTLETRLPAHTMVFQLPIRPFPADPGTHGLGPYAQFRPYLSSTHLRWSYPALTATQIAWEQRIAALTPQEWPAALRREGFGAILITRGAYEDDGRALADTLLQQPGTMRLGESEDFVAIGLSR